MRTDFIKKRGVRFRTQLFGDGEVIQELNLRREESVECWIAGFPCAGPLGVEMSLWPERV
jgi:hypothetical protein